MTVAQRNREAAEAAISEQFMELEIEAVKERAAGGFSPPEWFTLGGEVGEALQDEQLAGANKMGVVKTDYEKVTIYSTLDGTSSQVLVSMLAKQMKKRLPDGRLAFSITPVDVPARLDLKCYLHPEHERREELDAIGLAGQVCRKANIPTQFGLARHMRTRHKGEWEAIEAERQERERREALDVQRQMVAAMTGGKK